MPAIQTSQAEAVRARVGGVKGVLMDASQTWIVASLVVLAVVALLVLRAGKAGRQNRLTPLAALAFSCIVAGLLFGEERWLGYSLFAVGVVLAVVDMVRRSRAA